MFRNCGKRCRRGNQLFLCTTQGIWRPSWCRAQLCYGSVRVEQTCQRPRKHCRLVGHGQRGIWKNFFIQLKLLLVCFISFVYFFLFKVTNHSFVIHEYYARECNNPIHLTVDTTLDATTRMAFRAYVCVKLGVPNGKTGCMFTPAKVQVNKNYFNLQKKMFFKLQITYFFYRFNATIQKL